MVNSSQVALNFAGTAHHERCGHCTLLTIPPVAAAEILLDTSELSLLLQIGLGR